MRRLRANRRIRMAIRRSLTFAEIAKGISSRFGTTPHEAGMTLLGFPIRYADDLFLNGEPRETPPVGILHAPLSELKIPPAPSYLREKP
jgi:hypothetical protein